MEQDEYQKKIRAFYEPLLAAHGDKRLLRWVIRKLRGQRGSYVMPCEVGDLTTAPLASGNSFLPVALFSIAIWAFGRK